MPLLPSRHTSKIQWGRHSRSWRRVKTHKTTGQLHSNLRYSFEVLLKILPFYLPHEVSVILNFLGWERSFCPCGIHAARNNVRTLQNVCRLALVWKRHLLQGLRPISGTLIRSRWQAWEGPPSLFCLSPSVEPSLSSVVLKSALRPFQRSDSLTRLRRFRPPQLYLYGQLTVKQSTLTSHLQSIGDISGGRSRTTHRCKDKAHILEMWTP